MRAGLEATRETFLAEVLMKGLGGAVREWASVREMAWFLPGLEDGDAEPAPNGGANVYAKILERDIDSEVWYTVTPVTIAKGFDVLMKQEVEDLPNLTRDRLLEARTANDASRLDTHDADVLVQLGIFGRLEFE